MNGGAAVTLCATEDIPYGASWESDGPILYGQGSLGIWRVSENGGKPELLVTPDSESAHQYHGPQLLPGGEAILFTIGAADWDEARVAVQSLDTGEQRTVIERGRDAQYLPSGHLVYFHEGNLLAAAFDVDRLELTGGSVPVVENVAATLFTGSVQFSSSRANAGTLAFVSEFSVEPIRRLSWRDRSGGRLPREAPAGVFTFARSAPDGDRVAVARSYRASREVARSTFNPFSELAGGFRFPKVAAPFLDGQRKAS